MKSVEVFEKSPWIRYSDLWKIHSKNFSRVFLKSHWRIFRVILVNYWSLSEECLESLKKLHRIIQSRLLVVRFFLDLLERSRSFYRAFSDWVYNRLLRISRQFIVTFHKTSRNLFVYSSKSFWKLFRVFLQVFWCFFLKSLSFETISRLPRVVWNLHRIFLQTLRDLSEDFWEPL